MSSDVDGQVFKLYVRGDDIGDRIDQADIEDAFRKYARPTHVFVAQWPSGFAFVEYAYKDDAECARKGMDGTFVRGCRISVESSREGAVNKTSATDKSIKPGDWECGRCNVVNFARRSECFRCGNPKSGEGDGVLGNRRNFDGKYDEFDFDRRSGFKVESNAGVKKPRGRRAFSETVAPDPPDEEVTTVAEEPLLSKGSGGRERGRDRSKERRTRDRDRNRHRDRDREREESDRREDRRRGSRSPERPRDRDFLHRRDRDRDRDRGRDRSRSRSLSRRSHRSRSR